MNNFFLKTGWLSVVLIAVTSCNQKENKEADQRIVALETYVDSLKTVSDDEIEANWTAIGQEYEKRNAQASEALEEQDEKIKTALQVRIDASNTQYDQLKAKLESLRTEVAQKLNPSQSLRNRMFGAGKIGADMNFDWVNKSNILKVYENFFQAYKDNKSDFTREDYDEIKIMYEALDNRKNTVEKEGLSSADNLKIGAIKIKFGPMFKVNRMGAKARESAEAKE